MTWLAPLLGGVVAAIAIPSLLVLYFLKLRRKEVDVSTTLLWKKTIHDMQANAPFQRLRRNLLLYLQLLALALAILAIAQPTLRGERGQGGRHVLILDRSASMAADADGEPGGETRLDEAKARALAVLESIPEPGPFSSEAPAEVMVVAFDTKPAVVRSFTTNRAAVREAVERIEASSTPTAIADAMTLLRPYVDPSPGEGDAAPTPGAATHLFSDGRIADLSDARLHPDADFTYHAIGGTGGGAGEGDGTDGAATGEVVGNVGIVALAAERPFNEPGRVDIFARLINTAATARTVDVQLQIDGGGGDLRSITVPGMDAATGSAGSNGIVFSLDRPEAAVCTLAVLDEDALAADDRAHLVIPPARRLRLAMVADRPNPFLEFVLEATSPAVLDTLTPSAYERLIEAGETERYDLVVLDGVALERAPLVRREDDGAEPSEREDVEAGVGFPPGRYLVFNAAPRLPGVALASEAPSDEMAVVVESKREHPVLRVSPIDDERVFRQVRLEIGPPAEVVARSSEGPLIVETFDRDAQALIVAFDPARYRNDWALDRGFVVFVLAAIDYLVADDPTLSAGSLRTGTIASLSLPSGAEDARLEGPDGSSSPLPLTPDGRVNVGPLEEIGVYRLTWSGPPGPRDVTLETGRSARLLPVNLLDETESTIAPASELTFDTTAVSSAGPSAEPEGSRALWPWLLVGCLVIVLVEWWLYNRRVYL